MEPAESEPKLGTTIRIMMEEHKLLNEFTEMLKRKVELDMKYTRQLKELRDSWDPKWKESRIWPLVSPVLEYFGHEITHRQAAEGEALGYFENMPKARSPEEHTKDGFNPLELPGILESSFSRYQACHQGRSSQELADAFNEWHSGVILSSHDGLEVVRCVLPEQDREYRQATVDHNRNVSKALSWYSEGLHTALEEHQQHAETIQSLLHNFLREMSEQASELSRTCSDAMRSNRLFISTQYIGMHHDGAEKEKTHSLLKSAKYHNPNMDMAATAQLVFGLKAEDIIQAASYEFLTSDRMGRSLPHDYHLHGLKIYQCLQMEASEIVGGCLTTLLNRFRSSPTYYQAPYDDIINFLFWSIPPLFPLQQLHIEQYRDGVPRGKMRPLLDLIAPQVRPQTTDLLMKTWPFSDVTRLAGLFCHNYEAEKIIEDICSKWDFELDRPLPNGVIRTSNQHTPTLVYKRTGLPYKPT